MGQHARERAISRRGVIRLLAPGQRGQASRGRPAGGGTVIFWAMHTAIEAEKQALQAGADEFKQKTGTTVNIQFVPWGGAFGKYLAASEAKAPPDCGERSHVSPLSFAVARRPLAMQ